MAKDVIVACDFPSGEKTLEFLDLFKDVRKPFVKIGMELFYSEGPSIVREIKNRGHRIFLDLKLCDIPNTVESAMRQLAKLGVDMTNVHAYGGSVMMERALKGLTEGAVKTFMQESCDGGKAVKEDPETPTLIAVTQLTSTSQEMLNDELLIQGDINGQNSFLVSVRDHDLQYVVRFSLGVNVAAGDEETGRNGQFPVAVCIRAGGDADVPFFKRADGGFIFFRSGFFRQVFLDRFSMAGNTGGQGQTKAGQQKNTGQQDTEYFFHRHLLILSRKW